MPEERVDLAVVRYALATTLRACDPGRPENNGTLGARFGSGKVSHDKSRADILADALTEINKIPLNDELFVLQPDPEEKDEADHGETIRG